MGNDSGKYVFIQMFNDRQHELKVSGDLTWHELSEEFFSFLQGSGYVLSRQDFADYWAQYSDDIKFDTDYNTGCAGGCTGCDIPDFNIGGYDVNMNDTGAQVFDNIKVDLTTGAGGITNSWGAGSPYVMGEPTVTHKNR